MLIIFFCIGGSNVHVYCCVLRTRWQRIIQVVTFNTVIVSKNICSTVKNVSRYNRYTARIAYTFPCIASGTVD